MGTPDVKCSFKATSQAPTKAIARHCDNGADAGFSPCPPPYCGMGYGKYQEVCIFQCDLPGVTKADIEWKEGERTVRVSRKIHSHLHEKEMINKPPNDANKAELK